MALGRSGYIRWGTLARFVCQPVHASNHVDSEHNVVSAMMMCYGWQCDMPNRVGIPWSLDVMHLVNGKFFFEQSQVLCNLTKWLTSPKSVTL